MSISKKSLFLMLVAGFIAVIMAFTVHETFTNNNPLKGFAVVELFTSEGCSSCPPADVLISRVQKENADKPVYILTYHVDYWNRLGWRDPYSCAAYSQRQSKYSNWMHNSTVYTPQVIVNGIKEFVGSQENTLRNAINAAEQMLPSAQLNLFDVKVSNNKIDYSYKAKGFNKNTALTITIVQNSAITNVKAGENSGHTLAHVQIVRRLQNIILNGKGEGSNSIDIPDELKGQGIGLIAFLQDQDNGHITAAFKTDPQHLNL